VGFINSFKDIAISYDGGLDSGNGNPLPLNPTQTCGSFTTVENGDRIIVSVSSEWEPIVPIVPFDPFTITSQSERTILAAVSISVDGASGDFVDPNDGILTLMMSASPITYSSVGQPITYTYSLSNTGGGDLSAPFTVTDSIATTDCSSAPATLAPNSSFNCAGTYHITQVDLDSGSVTNQATASANGSLSNTETETITAIPLPALALSKSAFPTAASSVGAEITYIYTLTNTGNVSLTSPYTVTDDKIASVNIDCSGAVSPLAPGASTTCTASYSITNSDINNRSVVNIASASATYESTTVTSNSDTAEVSTSSLTLEISASPSTATLPNQVITYTYTISNNGKSSANSLSVTDNRVSVSCPSTTIPGESSINCTGIYTVTLADYDAGAVIINSATATANNGSSISSSTETARVVIVQAPALSATVSASPSQPVAPAATLPAGTVVTYTFTLTNTGNVTLSPPFSATDNYNTITYPGPETLAPGATMRFTETYTITAADVDAGSIINTGSASAVFGGQAIASGTVSATVTTFSGARFNLALSSSPTAVTQAGTSVVFTYTITNTGGKSLTSPYSITSSLLGTFNCSGISLLAPGASTSCQNLYTPSNTVTNTITAASAFVSNTATSVPSSSLPAVTVPYYVCSPTNLTLGALVYSDSKKTVTWTITNNVGVPLHLTSIEFNWNSNGGSKLNSVQLPAGTTISSGIDTDGYANLTGSWTINSGATDLKLLFSKSGFGVTGLRLLFGEPGCGPLTYH